MSGEHGLFPPDSDSLLRRWQRLRPLPSAEIDELFTPHAKAGQLGDRFSAKQITDSLHGFLVSVVSVMVPCVEPIHFAFRSLDRQWLILDKPLIHQANLRLWGTPSGRSTIPHRTLGSNAFQWARIERHRTCARRPSLCWSRWAGLPLVVKRAATQSNLKPAIPRYLNEALGASVHPEDFFSYIAAVAANPAYAARYETDLSNPCLRSLLPPTRRSSTEQPTSVVASCGCTPSASGW